MRKIETIVDWILTERCNLNCYYCLQNADTRNAKCEYLDYSFIEHVDETMLFHLTGGEPFLVPNLVDLCNTLELKGHYISMNTNLTLPINKFVEFVNPENILFINASVHYPYRKHHMEPFLRHYKKLRDAGFFVYSTVVMIPEEFYQIVQFIEEYQKQGIIMLPKLMRGINNGQRFPEAYTTEQNVLMKKMAASSIVQMSSNDRVKFQNACESNVSIDDWWNFRTNSITGTRCFDGYRYIRITENGDVVYCNNKLLGHIKTTGLVKLCQKSVCQYEHNGLCVKHV